jgi:hypothetical protein
MRCLAKKSLCFGCVQSIFWYFVERYSFFVDHCEDLKGWVKGKCQVIKELTSSKSKVFSYIL